MKHIQTDFINEALKSIGFKDLTKVQETVIPLLESNKDCIVEANTGSGKTHAFLLPIFEALKPENNEVQALILAPTRDLANQIYQFAGDIASRSEQPIIIDLFIGGSDRDQGLENLIKRQPHIVIGTPGRLYDLVIKENVLKAYTCKYFIIDEADMTLEHDFMDQVGAILDIVQPSATKAVFSATIPQGLKPFLKKYLKNPKTIDVHPDHISSLAIEHYFVKTKEQDRFIGLKKVVQAINPYLAIVFCNTKESSELVFNWMKQLSLNVVLIHGGLDYRKRKQLMKRIERLEFQYIVATDIFSRGIDIKGVSHIINYELPRRIDFYIHRTGRTGRVDFDGMAISLYEFNDNSYLDKLEEKGIKCVYKDIINKEIVDATVRHQRQKRERKENDLDLQAKLLVKKPKSIKPGYKKKYKQAVDSTKKKLAKKKYNKK
ncbi:MAG: DEAD/DEAH box helicase [Bacilli bacterium]|nr:DEAD/DEAH box helicase [Bacilli bacterium]MBN2877394.1 DEAD/DEAH box helicase [Bacilli bacterium]